MKDIASTGEYCFVERESSPLGESKVLPKGDVFAFYRISFLLIFM